MARIRGPLMSMEASGNFAGQMQFRTNRYGGHVYRPPHPSTQNQRAPTAAQASVRENYGKAVAAWRALSPTDRAGWAIQALALPSDISGWNLFFAAFDGITLPYTLPPIGHLITLSAPYSPPSVSLATVLS